MALTLDPIPIGSTDYPSIVDSNFSAIEAEVNSLAAQILAGVGDGSLLVLDEFDRDGIVGSQSYRLDMENYSGGAQITIGRRPTAVIAMGDQDISIAWLTVAGQKTRVSLTGDLVLDASSIVAGLPKTIYVGIPSSGTPQLFEDTATGNVLYIYSMTWNGGSLTDFRRMARILPAYPLIQDMAGQLRMIGISDNESNFVDDLSSRMGLMLPGLSGDNGFFDAPLEVVGGWVKFHVKDADGCFAPSGSSPDTDLELEVKSEAVRWNLDDIIFRCDNIPDTIFWRVDAGAVGDDRFVMDVRDLRLDRKSIGSAVISARVLSWGVFVKPVFGTPIAKDSTKVDMV